VEVGKIDCRNRVAVFIGNESQVRFGRLGPAVAGAQRQGQHRQGGEVKRVKGDTKEPASIVDC
jgi:hypothetical protein